MDLKIEKSITTEPKECCMDNRKEIEDFYVRLAAGMSGFLYWCDKFPLKKK